MMNQKESVFTATITVLTEMKVDLKGGDIKTLPEIKTIRDKVCGLVVLSFKEKKTKLDTVYSDEDLVVYSKGLINNWYRKDTRLNGNVEYVAKNPGSRAHVGSEEARELKKLRAAEAAKGATPETLALIDAAIEAKIAEHKSAKTPQPDLSKINPELLKALNLKAS